MIVLSCKIKKHQKGITQIGFCFRQPPGEESTCATKLASSCRLLSSHQLCVYFVLNISPGSSMAAENLTQHAQASTTTRVPVL